MTSGSTIAALALAAVPAAIAELGRRSRRRRPAGYLEALGRVTGNGAR